MTYKIPRLTLQDSSFREEMKYLIKEVIQEIKDDKKSKHKPKKRKLKNGNITTVES